MELSEFNQLHINDRANHLWKYGVYLISRVESEFKIALYQLNNYYVEVYYNFMDSGIEEIKAFKSIPPLSPYFDLIDMAKIFPNRNILLLNPINYEVAKLFYVI